MTDLVSLQKKHWSHEPGGDLGTVQTSKDIGCEIASLWNLSFNCIARNSSRLNRTYWMHHVFLQFFVHYSINYVLFTYIILRNSTVIHSVSSYWLMLFGCILPNHSLKIHVACPICCARHAWDCGRGGSRGLTGDSYEKVHVLYILYISFCRYAYFS